MNVHKNARLTPRGRERIVRQVESGQTPEAVAEAAGVCPRTVRKWVDRYRCEGLAGPQDRSSRPHRLCPADTPDGGRRDRAAASATLDGQADRRRDRRVTGHGQPCIEMDELARMLAFITPDRFGRLQGTELVQSQTAEALGLFFAQLALVADVLWWQQSTARPDQHRSSNTGHPSQRSWLSTDLTGFQAGALCRWRHGFLRDRSEFRNLDFELVRLWARASARFRTRSVCKSKFGDDAGRFAWAVTTSCRCHNRIAAAGYAVVIVRSLSAHQLPRHHPFRRALLRE